MSFGKVRRAALAASLVVALCATARAVAASKYFFVWAMEATRPQGSTQALITPDLASWRSHRGLGKDFLAVLDVRPGSSFGNLVAMVPMGNAAMAHHTNYAEPPDDMLYAN